MSEEVPLADFISALVADLFESFQLSFLEQMESHRATAESLSRPIEQIAREIDGEAAEIEFRANADSYESVGEARLALADRERRFAKALLSQGLPKVYIEAGEIGARARFRTQGVGPSDARGASGAADGDAGSARREPVPPGDRAAARLFDRLRERIAAAVCRPGRRRPGLRDIDIVIVPAAADGPDPSGPGAKAGTSDLEVKLKFKVVY